MQKFIVTEKCNNLRIGLEAKPEIALEWKLMVFGIIYFGLNDQRSWMLYNNEPFFWEKWRKILL